MLAATAYTGSHFPPEMPSNWVIFTWFSNVSPFISANATPSATTWLDDQKIKSNNSHSFRNQVLLKVWSRPSVVVQECVSGHDKGVASIEEKGVLRGKFGPQKLDLCGFLPQKLDIFSPEQSENWFMPSAEKNKQYCLCMLDNPTGVKEKNVQ